MKLLPTTEPTGYTPMPGSTGLTAGGRVHRPTRVRERRHWYLIGADDARFDYLLGGLSATLSAGAYNCARAGQAALADFKTHIVDKATGYLAHFTTLGPCWTARAEWHTGLFYGNHGMCAPSTSTKTTVNIGTISWLAGVAQVTTNAAHGLDAGQEFNITGVNPAGYNVTALVTSVVSTTVFTFALVSNPGAFVSAGSVSYGYATVYDDCYKNGYKSNQYVAASAGRGVQWIGPWGVDLAFQHGYGRQRVTHAQQVLDGALRDAADDLQAFSGAVWMQLDRERIACGFFGKFTNPRDRFDPIPAGIAKYAIQLEDGANSPVGSDDSQYNLWIQEDEPGDHYTGGSRDDNPYDGSGFNTSGAYTEYSYASKPIASIAVTAGVATVALSSSWLHPAPGIGDEVTITGNADGYNGTHTVTGGNGSTLVQFATGLTASSTTGVIYNRSAFAPFLYWAKAKAWLDSMPASQPTFVNITTRLPHDNNGGYDASTHEKEYEGTLNDSDAFWWGGTAGAFPPVNGAHAAFGQTAARDSMQMMASLNDMIRMIAVYSDARYGPDGWGIIVTTDQGDQFGDQGASYTNAGGDGTQGPYNNGGSAGTPSKTAFWDSSKRAFMYVRGPHFGDGVKQSDVKRITCHADVGPTLIDVFDLTDSHWLDVGTDGSGTRDGRSLMRVRDPADVAYDRMIPAFGDFKTGNGHGVVFADNREYVQLNHTKSSGKLFWRDPDQGPVVYNGTTYHPAFESSQVTPTTGDNDTLDAALTAARGFRFDPAHETHPAHTTASA